MSTSTINLEAIEQSTSKAIIKVLERYGIKTNGHVLNAADQSASELAGQLKQINESGKLKMKSSSN